MADQDFGDLDISKLAKQILEPQKTKGLFGIPGYAYLSLLPGRAGEFFSAYTAQRMNEPHQQLQDLTNLARLRSYQRQDQPFKLPAVPGQPGVPGQIEETTELGAPMAEYEGTDIVKRRFKPIEPSIRVPGKVGDIIATGEPALNNIGAGETETPSGRITKEPVPEVESQPEFVSPFTRKEVAASGGALLPEYARQRMGITVPREETTDIKNYREWLKTNPGKTFADYETWKAGLKPKVVTPSQLSKEMAELEELRKDPVANADKIKALEAKIKRDTEGSDTEARERMDFNKKLQSAGITIPTTGLDLKTLKTQEQRDLIESGLASGALIGESSTGKVYRKGTQFTIESGEKRAEAWARTRPVNVFDTREMLPDGSPNPGYGSIYPLDLEEVRNANKARPGTFLTGPQAAKALQQHTFLTEMEGAIDDIRGILSRPTWKEFSAVQIAELSRVLNTAPATGKKGEMVNQLINSKIFNALSSDQQDFAIALFSAKESAMGMRQVLGGGSGSDLVRAAIDRTLPGMILPSTKAMQAQLNAFTRMTKRLRAGIANPKLAEMKTPTGELPEISTGLPIPMTTAPAPKGGEKVWRQQKDGTWKQE